jgi:hypothetical protein
VLKPGAELLPGETLTFQKITSASRSIRLGVEDGQRDGEMFGWWVTKRWGQSHTGKLFVRMNVTFATEEFV